MNTAMNTTMSTAMSPMFRWRPRASALILILLVGLLAGCYPKYNWREMPVADGLAVVAFPARVDTAEREIELAGMKVTFVMTSATVDQTVFSFGYAQLPLESTPEERVQAQQAMIKSLESGMSQSVGEQALAGETFVLRRQAGDTELVMHAKVVLYHDVVMQQIVAGPPEELSQELADEFMRSLAMR